MKEELAKIRGNVEQAHKPQEVLHIYLPCSCFEANAEKTGFNVVDLPGLECHNKEEALHARQLAQRFLPHASVVLVVCTSAQITELKEDASLLAGDDYEDMRVQLENLIPGWKKERDRVLLVLTRAVSSSSLLSQDYARRKQADPACYAAIGQSIRAKCIEDARAEWEEFDLEVFPVEVGASYRNLLNNDSYRSFDPALPGQLKAAADEYLEQLRKAIQEHSLTVPLQSVLHISHSISEQNRRMEKFSDWKIEKAEKKLRAAQTKQEKDRKAYEKLAGKRDGLLREKQRLEVQSGEEMQDTWNRLDGELEQLLQWNRNKLDGKSAEADRKEEETPEEPTQNAPKTHWWTRKKAQPQGGAAGGSTQWKKNQLEQQLYEPAQDVYKIYQKAYDALVQQCRRNVYTGNYYRMPQGKTPEPERRFEGASIGEIMWDALCEQGAKKKLFGRIVIGEENILAMQQAIRNDYNAQTGKMFEDWEAFQSNEVQRAEEICSKASGDLKRQEKQCRDNNKDVERLNEEYDSAKSEQRANAELATQANDTLGRMDGYVQQQYERRLGELYEKLNRAASKPDELAFWMQVLMLVQWDYKNVTQNIIGEEE